MDEPLAAPGEYRYFIKASVATNDSGGDLFAELLVGQGQHGAFGHAGALANHPLDNLRIDVVAAGDNQIMFAPHEGQKTVSIDLTQIACVKPAAGERLARCFGLVPILAKQIW